MRAGWAVLVLAGALPFTPDSLYTALLNICAAWGASNGVFTVRERGAAQARRGGDAAR